MPTPLPLCYLVMMPDGQRVDLTQCSYVPSGSTVVFTPIGLGSPYTFTASSSANALFVAAQIDVIKQSGSGQGYTSISASPAIVWTSITPNTGTVNASYAGTIAGSGFSGSGINGFNLYLSGVPVITNIPFNISSDIVIQIVISNVNATPAGAYTLFFTINSGISYTTTALTLTVS